MSNVNITTPQVPENDKSLKCAENNPWNPLLPPRAVLAGSDIQHLGEVDPLTADLTLTLKQLDSIENERATERRRLVFHVAGCTGDAVTAAPQDAVAAAMTAQTALPESAAFLYHLGDIAYKPEDVAAPEAKKAVKIDLDRLYNDEFYEAYQHYPRRIVAVPGNHDGKYHLDKQTGAYDLSKSPMVHFLRNFCSAQQKLSPDNFKQVSRLTQLQPYPYWQLDTPMASLVGLYTNVLNGGQLDPPGTAATGPQAVQYQWLVRTLKRLKGPDNLNTKPILLMLHYPPFSGTTNFEQRGNPNSLTTPGLPDAPMAPISHILFEAFQESGVWPDAIFSAHAHLYQRITCTVQTDNGVKTIPFIIIGSGGHAPVEPMWEQCDKGQGAKQDLPFDVVLPAGATLPGAVISAKVVQYNDSDFGFMRVSIDQNRIVGEFFAAYPLSIPEAAVAPCRHDMFVCTM